MRKFTTLLIATCLLSTAACTSSKTAKTPAPPAKTEAPKKEAPKEGPEAKPTGEQEPKAVDDSKAPEATEPAKTQPAESKADTPAEKPAEKIPEVAPAKQEGMNAPSAAATTTDAVVKAIQEAQAKASEKKTKAPAPVAPAAAAKPEAKTPAPTAEWQFSEVRVLMVDTLQGAKKNNIGVIADNSLTSEESAKFKMFDRGFGMYCTTETPGDLKKGDSFKFVTSSKKPWPVDQHGSVMTIVFKDEKSRRELKFECITRGEQTSEDFVKNMKDILQFKDEQGQYAQLSPEKDSAYYAKQENKFRTFRIVKLDVIEKASVPKMGDKAQFIAGGKLVDTATVESSMPMNQMAEACQISEVIGKLRTDAVYKWTDTKNLGADRTRGFGMLGYTYNAGKKDALKMVCVLRLNASYDILLETLAGLVEFGVTK